MRGVVVFLVAIFSLMVWYAVGALVIEPLLDVARSFDLSALGGSAKLDTIRDIYFLYAPWVFLAGWFIWAVRHYVRKSLFVGEVRR